MKKLLTAALIVLIVFCTSITAMADEPTPTPAPLATPINTELPTPSLPEMPSLPSMPSNPDMSLPKLDMPKLTIPELDRTLLQLPEQFQKPIYSLPDMPDLIVPKINMAFDDLMNDLISKGFGKEGSLELPEITAPAGYGSRVVEDLQTKYETLWNADTLKAVEIPSTDQIMGFLNGQKQALEEQYASVFQSDSYKSINKILSTSNIWKTAQNPPPADYFGALPTMKSAKGAAAEFFTNSGWESELKNMDKTLSNIIDDLVNGANSPILRNESDYRDKREQILITMASLSSAADNSAQGNIKSPSQANTPYSSSPSTGSAQDDFDAAS